ncbi:MAG: PKD domain-containing protein [Candidatus Thermoplasmatota archaeon]|nr:PKD domain-containing protein [Candidatus Thermoplasmatota archaeon]
MIWIAALLLGSGLLLVTAPAWASDGVSAGIPTDTGGDVMVSAPSPTEAVGQAGSGNDLVRLSRSGNMATLEIGPVTPNAFLPLLILPNHIEDPRDADAAVEDGARLAGEFQADPNGMFEITYPMDSVNTSLRMAAYSRVQGNVTYLGTFVPNPMHESFQPPPVKPLGPVTIEVHPSQVIVLNGPGPEDDEVLPGGNYPLVTALRAATPGSDPVLGIYGAIQGDGMQIGAGDSDFKGYVAHWGPVPMRFSVVGMTPDAKIGELGFRNRMNNGTVHGGVADARFENLTIEARYSMAVGGGKGERFGILRFYNVHFATSEEGLASGAFEGFGYKWGVRIRALGRYDFRNCTFDPVLEHAIYVDSPQGDSYFQGIEHHGSTRTAIQIVNRAFDTSDPNQLAEFESGVNQVQPSAHGRLLIEDVTIRDLRGDGGSAITVAGYPGDVFIRNITAVDLQNPFQGAVVVYTDAGWNHGAYLHTGGDGNLYSTYSLSLEDPNVNLPLADRTHVGISGIEFVRIHDFSIAGSRTAIALDSWYNQARFNDSLVVIDGIVTRSSATINNGIVEFCVPRPLSQYPGFDSARKIADSWYLDAGGSQRANVLSDAEIDAIWPDAGCDEAPTSSSPFVVEGEDTEPPSAVISGPIEVDVDVSFSLDARGSSDNYGVANYTWDLGDGRMAYGPTVSHAYDEAGNYTITLTVRDASGNEDTTTLPITVLAAAPDGGGFQPSDTALYGLLAGLALAGITAGVLYWRRGDRAAGPRGPPTRPEGEAQKKPLRETSKKPPEEPPEPELDALAQEIEDVLKP